MRLGDLAVAGERAAEQARLAAQRVARLRQQLEQAERAERAWAKGAAGEARVGQMLDELSSIGWLALHDVHWPGRSKANIDHILVGPGGVIVIDAKNWSGDVQVHNGVLRRDGYSKDREVSAVLEQGAAVAALLEPQHRRLVQSWLCLVSQANMDSSSSSGARIQGLATLGRSVEAMPAVLDPTTVQIIHSYLLSLLSAETSPPLVTTKDWNPGPSDLRLASAPAVALESRRSWQHSAPVSTNSRTKRTARSKPPGCSAAFLYLALAIFVLGVLLNAWPQAQRQPPAAPRPSSMLVQTDPPR
jgi:hypothetical protein